MQALRIPMSLAVFSLIASACTSPEHTLLSSSDTSFDAGASFYEGASLDDAMADCDARAGGCSPTSPCRGDLECAYGSVCLSETCEPCSALATCETCADGWTQATSARNGCAVCFCEPPQGCTSDRDCDGGGVCYAGQSCSTDCPSGGDPSCCYGNVCGAPGCGSSGPLDCAIVGCPPGLHCDITCSTPFCQCDPQRHEWLCDPSCGPNHCN